MANTTFEVHLPTPLLQFGLTLADVQDRVTEWLVISLFTDGHISSGKAARFLNITRPDFLRLLHKRDIAYVNFTPDEMDEELAAVEKLDIQVKP